LLLGDIDNDGDLDLLTSSGFFGMYSHLNDGTGHFTAFQNTIIGNTPSGATLADVNQDGYLDLIAADADNATVAIALNSATGTGSFALNGLGAQLLPVGSRPVSVTTGDVDGDGDLDLVTANATANTVSVALNNGVGVFGTVSTVSVSAAPSTVQLADVDGDGDLDLLTSGFNLGMVSVRFNNGSGTFSGSTGVQVGATPTDLALADLDNDGDLDLLTCNSTARTISVRLNSGGTFSGTTLSLPTGSSPTALTTGDVDADGDLDVVVAQGTGGQVLVLLNNGSGTLTLQTTALTVAISGSLAITRGVALGDVDGDGDLDVVTSDENSGRVILGRGVALPTISALNPANGIPGNTLTIVGTNLRGVRRVTFAGIANNVAASGYVANASGTQLTGVIVPAGAATGAITVTTAAGTATSPTFSFDLPQLAVLQGGTALLPAGTGYTFGTQVIGSPAASATFILRNTGSQPLTISSATASGDFTVSSGPASLTVPAGGSTTVAVTFGPTALGGRSGSLIVASNAAGFPSYVLPLQGTAVPPPPTLTALLPASAPAGDTISLSGTNLATATAITFAGSSNNVVSTGFVAKPGGTRLTGVLVPAGATTGPVSVRTAGGTTATLPFTLLPPPPPVLGSLAPASAHVGDTITLHGTRMSNVTYVSFDGYSAEFFLLNNTTVRAIVPIGAGNSTVTVRNLAGTSNGLPMHLLPLITKLVSPAGPVGRYVRVEGYYLSPTGATFGGVSATFATQSNLQYVVVPAGAQSGSFRLITGADTSNALPFTVTVPIGLTSVSPTAGAVGSTLTITGSNLQGISAISFEGGAGQNTVRSGFTVNAAGTQLTGVVVPPGARTGLITLTSTNGYTLGGLRFTVTGAVGPTVPAWQSLTGAQPVVGSGGSCVVQAVTTDAVGNVYIAGSFTDRVGFGSTVLTAGNTSQSGFVAKWSAATQAYVWAIDIASYGATVNALVVQGSSVYLAGSFYGPSQFGTIQMAASADDGFVAKLTDAGSSASFAWVQRAGSAGLDNVNALVVQGTDVFIAGSFGSSITTGGSTVYYPLQLGSLTLNGAGSDEIFVAKLTDAGSSASYVWGQRAGGTGSDYAAALAVNGSNIYVGGRFTSNTARFGSLTLRTNTNSVLFDTDGFITKLTDAGSSASFVWVQAVRGASNESVAALAVSGSTLYAAGRYYDSAAIGGVAVGSAVAVGGENGFVFKLTDNGLAATPVWGQAVQALFGNTSTNALAVQGSAVYVAGHIAGPTLAGNFTTADPYGCYLARLNDSGSTGSFAWLQQGGGPAGAVGTALSLSGSRVYVAGYATGGITFDALQLYARNSNRYGYFATLVDGVLTDARTAAASPTTLVLYPNPAHGSATLLLPPAGTATTATLTLHDALGRVVQAAQVSVPVAGMRYELPLQGLPTGTYLLSVTTADSRRMVRLTVE
jgi:hypothetical protein